MLNILFTQTPLKYMVQSFWRDEAFSYLLAKKNILEMFVLTSRDFNPPLYYLLLHFWMKIAGHSELALRLLSLIFFWLTLYVFFLFLINVLKIKTAWAFVYLLLFLVNPFLNYYAFEARMYMFFAFLASLSFYLFIRRKNKAYAFVTILGLYTHYLMFFVIFSQFAYLLLQKNHAQTKRYFKIILLSFLFFLPWLVLVFVQKSPGQQFWITPPNLATFINIPMIIYTGYESDLTFYSKNAINLSISLMIFFILALRLKKQSVFLIWAFLSPVVVYFISFFIPFFLPRYLIFSSVGLLLLIVAVLQSLNSKLRIVFLLVLFFLTLNYNYLQIKNREKADARKVIHEIKKIAGQNDLLYVTSVLDFHIGQYYFDENKTFIYGKSYEEVPNFVGKVIIPKEKLTNTLPLYPQKAFILKDNLTYDIQARY